MSKLRDELKEAAESVFEGWYINDSRIDWEEFIDRLEALSGIDLGDSMLSDEIRAIKAYVRKLRKETNS